jgi:hypothetical protein
MTAVWLPIVWSFWPGSKSCLLVQSRSFSVFANQIGPRNAAACSNDWPPDFPLGKMRRSQTA